MKSYIFILLVILSSLLSCQKENLSPMTTAKEFEENIHAGNIEKAKKYANEMIIEVIESNTKLKSRQIDPNFKFIFIKDSISGNNAWVWYKNQNDKEMREKLMKINNNWTVVDRQKVEIIKYYYDSKYKKQEIKVKTKPN